MAFGYPKDYYFGELARKAGRDPYKYYELYIEMAKTDPQRLMKLATNEYQKNLRNFVREQLGAAQATETAFKKISPEKLDDFKEDADALMTKQQVEQLANKYLNPGR